MKPPFDESNLERDGARAAQADHSWRANPFLQRENMPGATGETLREWSRKHDAWQRGYEGHDADSPSTPKEALPSELLADVVEDRLRTVPRIREALQQGFATLRVALPQPHARDAAGRNWDLEGFECGTLQADDCDAEFRSVVDALRDRYDLAGTGDR
ncbi:CrpP-related protein [Eleftheria terrae]|uniref:CrpP-related protein n=1 Tax=Eleftheria terrae TaxID=1597781 RepID=UPI00263BA29B|nr:CrpP-related protein [Eleftheria terrae]WKB55430.1 hypothetical protein N7L95_25465 [Eleftheria terrae]